MDFISLIISAVLAVAFIINAIVTHTMSANRDRRNDHRELQDKIGQLQDKIGQLQVAISEIKIELSQIRKDVSNIEARQLKMEKEIDTIRRDSDEKRLQINMIEAHRHVSHSPQMLETSKEESN